MYGETKSKDSPLVSIVIKNFNYGEFLGDAIRSVLEQDYPRVESIVVDDGSTDCSRAQIEQYSDRCRFILQEHQGQAATINRGYECSNGDIVLFLDSDDRLQPNAVGSLVEAWRPGLSLLCFDLQAVNATGHSLGRTFGPRVDLCLSRKEILRSYGACSISPTSSSAYSRTTLARFMPMDEVVWRHGTHAFMNMSALVYGEVRNLGVVLGQRRMHGANQSQAVWTDIKSLQSRFLSQLELPATLAAHAKRGGLSLDPTGIRVRPGLFKLSIMSWRLDSPNHPIVGDSRLKILRAGMKAIWSFPPYTFTRCVFTTCAFLALALIPKTWIRKYFSRIAAYPRMQSWIHPQ